MTVEHSEYSLQHPSAVDWRAVEQHVQTVSVEEPQQQRPAALDYLESFFRLHPQSFHDGRYADIKVTLDSSGICQQDPLTSHWSLKPVISRELQYVWRVPNLDIRLRELIFGDMFRFRGWLEDPDSFPAEDIEACGFGATLVPDSTGYLLQLDADASKLQEPVEIISKLKNSEEYHKRYQLQHGPFLTAERLARIGVMGYLTR